MIKDLLEKRSREELLDFLIQYAEADAKFANAVNVHFGNPEFEEELRKIKDMIDDALDGVTDYRMRDSWGNVNFYTGDIIDEVNKRASQGHIRLAFAEIELLFRKLTGLFEYQGECEIHDETEYCINVMSDIADKAVASEDKEHIFQKCIELSYVEECKNYGGDFEDLLLGISAKLVTPENRIKLEQAITSFESGRQKEALKQIRLDIIARFDGRG